MRTGVIDNFLWILPPASPDLGWKDAGSCCRRWHLDRSRVVTMGRLMTMTSIILTWVLTTIIVTAGVLTMVTLK